MIKGGESGKTLTIDKSLETMRGFDGGGVDSFTLGSNVNLQTGNTDDGRSRANFYYRAIHNYGVDDAVVVGIVSGGGSSAKTFRIPSGGFLPLYVNLLTLASTSSGTVNIYYQDRSVIDGDARRDVE